MNATTLATLRPPCSSSYISSISAAHREKPRKGVFQSICRAPQSLPSPDKKKKKFFPDFYPLDVISSSFLASRCRHPGDGSICASCACVSVYNRGADSSSSSSFWFSTLSSLLLPYIYLFLHLVLVLLLSERVIKLSRYRRDKKRETAGGPILYT